MTTTPPDQRRYGVLLLGVAVVFVTIAIVAGAVVTPWMYLVGLTAIPNVITGVKALRGPKPIDP
jgi:hypothetical protein